MRADGVDVRLDAEHHRLSVPNAIAGESAVLFIDWDEASGAAQVVQTLPWPIPEERVNDVAVAILRANHSSVLPAFGLNVTTRVAYCRGVIPLAHGSAEVRVVRSLIAAVARIARQDGPALAAMWRTAA